MSLELKIEHLHSDLHVQIDSVDGGNNVDGFYIDNIVDDKLDFNHDNFISGVDVTCDVNSDGNIDGGDVVDIVDNDDSFIINRSVISDVNIDTIIGIDIYF